MQKYSYQCLIASVVLTLSCPSVFAIPTFTGLGDLPGGPSYSTATAVSAEGSVVVGASFSEQGLHAFRWSANEGMIGIDNLTGGAIESFARGISADGSTIVGGRNTVNGHDAFKWTVDGGMEGIGLLSSTSTYAEANAISSDGNVIVGYGDIHPPDSPFNFNTEIFSWTSSTGMSVPVNLPQGYRNRQASCVSYDGSVIAGTVQWFPNSDYEAFRWTADQGMVSIGELPGGFGSSAYAISSDGSVIVGSSNSSNDTQAFRWELNHGMVGLGYLPESHRSVATGVSSDGSIIVGSSATLSGNAAFIWDDNNGMQDLRTMLISDYGINLTDWTLSSASAVSADGSTIVGWGKNPAGDYEAWIVSNIPEPASLSLLMIGGLFLVRRQR